MGPTALLPLRRKACRGFFRPKNPTASEGFEPANLGTKGQHATPRPPKPIIMLISYYNTLKWVYRSQLSSLYGRTVVVTATIQITMVISSSMKNQFVIMRGTQDNDSSFLVRCAVSTGKTVTDVSSHRNASIFTVKHQQSTRHNIPDDFNLQHHHCDNLKSRTNTGRSNELPVRYCHTIGGAKKKKKKKVG